jgi:hypothetical protein
LSDVYAPKPVTTPTPATPEQAVEFYRTEFSRIVGESLRLKAENNRLTYALAAAQRGIVIAVPHVGDEQLPITTSFGSTSSVRSSYPSDGA